MSKRSRNTSQPQQGQGNINDQPSASPDSDTPPKQTIVFRSAILAASAVVILAGVKAASSILTLVLLALFITILLLVPLRWLQSKGIPPLASFGIVSAAIVLLLLVLGWLVTNSLYDFKKNSQKYTDKFVESADAIECKLQEYGYTIWAKSDAENTGEQKETNDTHANNISAQESPAVVSQNAAETQPITTPEDNADLQNTEGSDEPLAEDEMPTWPISHEKLDPKLVMHWITWGVGQFGNIAENIFLFVIILMFMVFEAAKFPAKLQKAFGGSPITNEHFHEISENIRRYIVFKAISNALSCVSVTVFYYVIGVPYALLWGVIAFFLYFIPNIGAFIAVIPPLLLIFVDQGLGSAVTLIVGLLIIESIIGYGIEPRLLGQGLGISTVVVFLSLVFWGWLLGPVGLFLAAPLTIVLKIILQAFDETRWVAILLAEKVQAVDN